MKTKLGLLFGLTIAGSLASAQGAPTVTYTATGSAGNWNLEFSVTNNMVPGEGTLYFFGVLLGTGNDIVADPPSWNSGTWAAWDNTPYGGSGTIYNNNWIDTTNALTNIQNGATMSGFIAHTTAAVAPTTVNFFAYGIGGSYNGNDYFNADWNPGFEGIASLDSVPEPASLAVLGLGALALVRRRRK